MRRGMKRCIVGAGVCAMLFLGFYIFAKNYSFAIPFDANRMFVERFKTVAAINSEGERTWIYEEEVHLHKDNTLGNGLFIPEEYETLELVRLAYHGINHITSLRPMGRMINRDGENIWVVYYCYTKTLWDSLVYDADRDECSESAARFDIYGDELKSPNYEPKMREIYYLQEKDLIKLDELSDEEFDGLRKNADLIWSGII